MIRREPSFPLLSALDAFLLPYWPQQKQLGKYCPERPGLIERTRLRGTKVLDVPGANRARWSSQQRPKFPKAGTIPDLPMVR